MVKKEYTYKCFVEHSDGRVERLEDISQAEKERLAELWGQRVAETLAQYYSANPEEFGLA
ncbi:MAG: hypothetical protein IJA02_09290 [Clostridia bacterium]|nr:hypothetical protein [Clostridia bacterium]